MHARSDRYVSIQPFYSQVTDSLAVGSLPLAVDVPFLRLSQNIDIVVNMCREYQGPTSQYTEHSMVQIYIPTPDVCEPVYRDIVLGLWQVRQHKKRLLGDSAASSGRANRSAGDEVEGVRVFVHCKAGRGRAATFALCYLISEGHEPKAAMDLLKKQRSVVESHVLHFRSVAQFIDKHKMFLGDLELMVKALE